MAVEKLPALLTTDGDLCYTATQIMRFVSTQIAFLVLFTLVFTGCETVVKAYKDLTAGGEKPDPQEQLVKPVFVDGPRIKPGVALVIQVGTPSSPPTVINTLVDQKGEVTIPLLLQEPVACDGLSLEAFKQKLVKAYSASYRQPQISVTFAPFDPQSGVSPWGTVTVLGQVMAPGPVNIPPTMELTVTKALTLVHGLKPFANRSKIQVSRCNQDGQIEQTIVDLDEIGKGGRADKDMILKAGDVVWVPETWY